MGRRSSLWLLAGLAMLLGGCSGPTVVSGKVTCDGQPVEKGSITFEPAEGSGQPTGGAIEGGRYQLSGPAAPGPGKQIVRIRGMRKTGKSIKAGPPFPPDKMIDVEEEYIGESYNVKSALTAEIAAGVVNEKNFELSAKGR
jgi:hypothetical protein